MTPGESHAWAVRLGIVAIVFGLLFTASSANELMKFSIVGAPPFTVETMPEPDCEEDELEEEGLSLLECRQLALTVHDVSISSPGWFVPFHMTVSAVGMIVGLVSVVIGVALVDERPWATTVAAAVFAVLVILDVLSFMAVVNTGPLLRQMYLWDGLLWICVHLTMAVAAIVGRTADTARPDTMQRRQGQRA